MPNPKNSAHWLLIANSSLLSDSKLLSLAKNKNVMVLDGIYAALSHTLKINVLLGDFDSITTDELNHAKKSNISIIHAPNQNQTDLEKGIAYLDTLGAESITICSATERRLQHTLFNLLLLKRCHKINRHLILYTEKEIIRYVQNSEVNIQGRIQDSVGILGFPYASITTTGLLYDVTDYTLDFAYTSSVSNSLVRQQAFIKVKGDALIIHETDTINKPTIIL